MNDGLASGEIRADALSGTNLYGTSGTFVKDTVTTAATTTDSITTASGTTAQFGSITNRYLTVDNVVSGGVVLSLLARTAISGGNLAAISGGEIYAAGAFSTNPKPLAGVHVGGNVASGAAASVLVEGVYTFTASDTVVEGQYAYQGSGTNCVMSAATPTANTFGRFLGAAASGATVKVLLG